MLFAKANLAPYFSLFRGLNKTLVCLVENNIKTNPRLALKTDTWAIFKNLNITETWTID